MFAGALRPLSLEAGSAQPTAAAFRRIGFLPTVCESDLGDEMLAAIGEHEIFFSLFGVPLSTTLTVADTTPPAFTLRDHAVLGGHPFTAEDFIESAADVSDFTWTMHGAEEASAPGRYEVRLTFTDACGNTAEGTAALTVHGTSDTVTLEAGCSADDCRRAVTALVPGAQLAADFDPSILAVPGENIVQIAVDGRTFRVRILVQDTTPPRAELKPLYTLNGRLPAPEEYLVSVTDATAVTAVYEKAPDPTSIGKHRPKLILTDAAGNTASVEAELTVLYVSSAVTMEAGSDNKSVVNAILRGDTTCSLVEQFDFASMQPGTYAIALNTPGGVLEVALTLKDTTPPFAFGKRVAVYLPTATIPTPADFVDSIEDFSAVTAAFTADMDFATPGSREVTIRLTDAAGNTADIEATLDVYDDHIAPVITGVKNLTAYVGGRISYKSGVSALDNDGTSVTIAVDSSTVNLNKPGRYRITYSATDNAGNTATATATVTVLEVTEDVIRPYAENVLDRILKDGMTKLEKARAIYNWMTTSVSYVTYADKTYWMRAAYVGFTTGRGDCYVYYAMSRILLDCAGIDNMEIKRDNPAQPHYWNLVNCGDGWYHFDTCPHYKQYPLTSFMLTDAEVREYSEKKVKDYYSFDESLYPATPDE